MDNRVETGGNALIDVPLRVTEKRDGAEVKMPLFRQPEMADAKFAAGARGSIAT